MVDILMSAAWPKKRMYMGRVTGRAYGRLGQGETFWCDPADAAADIQLVAAVGTGPAVMPTPAPEPRPPATTVAELAARVGLIRKTPAFTSSTSADDVSAKPAWVAPEPEQVVKRAQKRIKKTGGSE